jgi:hypothetical protein
MIRRVSDQSSRGVDLVERHEPRFNGVVPHGGRARRRATRGIVSQHIMRPAAGKQAIDHIDGAL